MPPCVAERRGSERGGATGRSATSSEVCSVVNVPHREVGQGGAEPVGTGRRPWNALLVLERVRKNLPAYGDVERSDGCPGNWRDPPRPASCGGAERVRPI